MTADFVGNGRVLVEHQQRLHHQRPREHMHFRIRRLLDPSTRAARPRGSHCARITVLAKSTFGHALRRFDSHGSSSRCDRKCICSLGRW